MSSSLPHRIHLIATIGADGIGPEVVEAGVQVLKTLSHFDGSFTLDFKDYDWSSETYKKTGQYIPAGGLDDLRKHDAILFGAVGAPGIYTLTMIRRLLHNLTLLQTFLIMSHYGVSAWPSASHYSSTQMYDRLRYFVAPRRHCARQNMEI